MAVDRRLWKQPLHKYYAPSWPCPTCAGKLRFDRESLRYEETLESKQTFDDEHDNTMERSFVFSAWFLCERCNEKVSCSGSGGYEPAETVDENGYPSIEYELEFYPTYFSAPMPIIALPAQCPPLIREEIKKAFAIFFLDLAASANHVRQCAEIILTHLGMPQKRPDGNFIPLGERIKELEKHSAENSARVSALRWIGNFGSHPEPLRKDNLFDAFEILDVLLEDLFVGHLRSVHDMVQRINAAKSPRSI
jgi:hypothetical protein